MGFNALHTKSVRLEERKAQLKISSDLAVSVAKEYGDLASSGQMPEADAKREALARIKSLRYGESGYFTVLDSHHVLMHPFKPELVGSDVAAFKDPNGTQVYVDALRVVHESGAGFSAYLWPKPGEKEPVSKLAFDMGYKPWDWTFMTGLYMDDLDLVFKRDLIQTGLLLVVIGLLLGVVVGLVMRSIEKAIGGDPEQARGLSEAIAEGDLRSSIDIRPNDSGSIMLSMKTMQSQLVSTIGALQVSATEIATASQEISQGNHDLSARTEQQASALEETASAMEELIATVRQNADNASEANALAQASSSLAAQGGLAVGEMANTMGRIQDSSKKIVDIISVVDGIAFQTNILALNAAVEAARAGEQGRGFAVVASEVRNLAQRSLTASREIKDLINESVSTVDVGTTLAKRAADTMSQVVESAKKVSQLVAEISNASTEQTAGIEQVNQAITSMDQTTQQNAALVEEAAAAAESMRDQASVLAEVIQRFKIGNH